MEEKRYLKVNDIEAYRISFHLSNFILGGSVLEMEYFCAENDRCSICKCSRFYFGEYCRKIRKAF